MTIRGFLKDTMSLLSRKREKEDKVRNKLLFPLRLTVFFVFVASMFVFGDEEFKIAILKSRDIAAYNSAISGFNDELSKIKIKSSVKYFDMSQREIDDEKILLEIRKMDPDLILPVGTEATELTLKNINNIPIVFTMVLDPVESGLTKSYDASGKNYTGVILSIPVKDQITKLKDLVPSIKNIGMLYDEKRAKRIEAIKSQVEKLDLNLNSKSIKSLKELPGALDSLLTKSDALWAEVDPFIYNSHTAKRIILATFTFNKPFMVFSSSYVKAGALAALECDYFYIGKQTGKICADVLRGKDPGEIPIVFPEEYYLVINRHTAKYLGIKIPSSIKSLIKKYY